MKLIKHNTREAVEILRVLASSTLVEKKVCMNIAYALNKITERDWKGKGLYLIEIPMETLTERTTSNYEAIKRICRKLTTKSIQMKIPYTLKNGITEIFDSTQVIFPSCGISENTFKIEVKETVLPLFSRALEKYRHYNIIEAKFLKHKHSIEMYKFLKDYINRDKGNRIEISVKKLRYELGLEDKYKLYMNFKKRVLEPVKTDLKKNSVLYFDYKEKKTGRGVTHLYIDIIHNTKIEADIHTKELLAKYIKQAPEDAFKKDFEDFLRTEYCLTSDGKKLYKPQYTSEMEILKTKKSISEYSEETQWEFARWLQPRFA